MIDISPSWACMGSSMSQGALVGYVERVSANGNLEGWVSAVAGERVELEFLAGDQVVGSCNLGGAVRLGALRPFSFPLPADLLGNKHAVVITGRLRDGRPLGGKAVYDDQAARFVGLVTDVGAGAIAGFVRDIKCPNRAVVVSLFCGSAIVALGVTGEVSRGAAPSGFSHSDGFVIPVPVDWHVAPSRQFNLYVSNSSVRLNETPLFMFMGAASNRAPM